MERRILTDNLRRLRNIKRMNQAELAKKAGLSRPSYVDIENGNADPRSSTLINIANSLGVQLADFFKPLPSLKHVRFRIAKNMSRRDENNREQLLQEIAEWLKDYNEIENILGKKQEYGFAGYNKKDPIEAAKYARNLLGIGQKEAIRDICGLVEKAGIKIYLSGSGIKQYFGLSIGIEDGGPAVCVRVGNDISVERQIFTLAHEVGHLLLHRGSYDKNEVKENAKEDREADIFASHFLMPQEGFLNEWNDNNGSFLVNRILHVKRIFKVSYMTVLMRLRENKFAEDTIFQRFAVEYKRLYGHDLKNHYEPDSVSKYEPEGLAKSDFMENRLNRLVREAYDKELISMDRAAEILKISIEEMRELNNSWKEAI